MNFPDGSKIFSVSEFTKALKGTLELQFRFVHIRGEISNLRIPHSGHMYFTLKDSTAQIKAVLFKSQQIFLGAKVREGQSIICHGRISVYEPRGEYQLIVDTIDQAGAGDLRLQFEKLKAMLSAEGLFRAEAKKDIPPFPDHIVLVTSPSGAAVHDFLRIAQKREYWGKISILPVAVQGASASGEIASAIHTACSLENADVIVLLRGGGSLEDLWAFNEEKTARAVYHATLPVVTGIGHDTDITIADLCADLHMHTPTAAAQVLMADRQLLRNAFTKYQRSLVDSMRQRIASRQERISQLRRIMGNMDLLLANCTLKLDYRMTSLIHTIERRLSLLGAHCLSLQERLGNQAPLHRLALHQQKLDHLQLQLENGMQRLMERKEEKFRKRAALLDSVSPLSILARGYAIVSRKEAAIGELSVISRYDQVEAGAMVDVRLHRGTLECEVVARKDGDHFPGRK